MNSTNDRSFSRRAPGGLTLGLLLGCVLFAVTAAGAGTLGVVPSADGAPISYEVHGEGEPTLILVHGWSCDARYWREQIAHFADRHRVVTVDLAGHGESGTGREDYTTASFGEDVRAVADAVGGERFILVGHSMGGLVIAEAARLMPGRVLGLIGVDALHNLDYPVTEELVAEMIAPLEADFPAACRQFAAEMILPDTDTDLAEWIQADMAAAPPNIALSAMRGYMAQWVSGAAPELFKELSLPVVAVCADMWPVDAEANRRYMKSFEAIVLEGTDHFLMLAAPEEFNRALEKAIVDLAPAEEAMGTLVTPAWLNANLGQPDLVVLDCTIVLEPKEGGGFKTLSGREVYEESHIPTAAFADLKGALSDTDSPLQYALPTPEAFCEAMGKLGVGDHTRVVVYDRMMSVWAARVWWMLRWVGFDQVAVLDGGWDAWVAEELPQSNEPASYQPGKLTPNLRPELVADRDEVFAALEDQDVTLIDAMPAAHFRGDMALYDRPGHIPGAVNISSTELLGEDGRFKPLDELTEVFTFGKEGRSIIYCGSGISASGVAFAMTRAGFTDVAVYTASLQEWAADEANPLVVEGD